MHKGEDDFLSYTGQIQKSFSRGGCCALSLPSPALYLKCTAYTAGRIFIERRTIWKEISRV